jgi:hypothetical protein
VLLGHYHVSQKVSRRTWYAGSTDSFSFGDRPADAGPKGLIVVDTQTGAVRHHANPLERPLVTFAVETTGLGPSEILEACAVAGAGSPPGAIVRLFLNHVDPAAYRQIPREDFQVTVPQALHVQDEPDFDTGAIPVQGGPEIGSLESEWAAFVEMQDLAGLDRQRVLGLGRRFLETAKGEAV